MLLKSQLLFKKITVSRMLFCILLMGFTSLANSHTYFFAVSELNFNNVTKHIEVIHQITAHDIENAISEIHQINFSTEHPQYDKLIKAYIEKHFVLVRNNTVIKMNWIGFEVKRGQIFAYQESADKNNLPNLVVKNSILVDTYAKQINTVNYQSLSSTEPVQGSLTFDQSLRVAIITSNE